VENNNLLLEPDSEGARSIDVELLTVDEITRRFVPDVRDVSLLKIDVEGHEGAVLRGSLETIRKGRPIIYLESEQKHGVNVREICQFVIGLDYSRFVQTPDGAFQRAQFNQEISDRPVNYIFFPAGYH
jgi:hypothetical protein